MLTGIAAVRLTDTWCPCWTSADSHTVGERY